MAVVVHRVFKYHPKYKKIGLTHLCFADDLLIFAKGNLDLVIGIQNVLKQFYSISGLQLNSTKSEFFSFGITSAILKEIQKETGFKIGTLLGILEYQQLQGGSQLETVHHWLKTLLIGLIAGLLGFFPMLGDYS